MSKKKREVQLGRNYPQEVYESIIKWKTLQPNIRINEDFLAKINADCQSDITLQAVAVWWSRYKKKKFKQPDDESTYDAKVVKNEASKDMEDSNDEKDAKSESGTDDETSDGLTKRKKIKFDSHSHAKLLAIPPPPSNYTTFTKSEKSKLEQLESENDGIKVNYTAMSIVPYALPLSTPSS